MENNKVFDVFNQYAEAQKNMMEMWTKMFVPGAQKKDEPATFSNPLEFFKPVSDFWTNSFFGYTGSPFEMYEKMSQGTSSYFQLYQLWQDIYNRNLAPNQENVEKLTREWMDKSTEMAQRYFLPLFPPEMQNVLNEIVRASEIYGNAVKEYMGPWKDSFQSFTDAMAKGMMSDPKVFLTFFDEWENAYKETFSKALNMPMMGITRETAEAQMQAVDRYIKMIGYSSELMAKVVAISNENTQDVIVQSFEDLKDGNQPRSFEEFYKFWKDSLSKAFDDLFYSDEFSQLLAEMVDALMDFKIAMNKVLEKNLSVLPIPVKSDMDSLYKTVYDLKREVRAMKKQVEALEASIEKLAGK